MRYREVPPPPALGSIVECFWSLRGAPAGEPAWQRVFPDGCIELIVHLESPFASRVDDSAPSSGQPRAFVVGQLSRPFALLPLGAFHTLGVRFRPAGAFAVLGVDLHALADTIVPLDALWGGGAVLLVEELAACATDEACVRVLASRLRVARAPHAATRRAADVLVERRGLVSIAALARDVGWSERQLERRFEREVGLLPKTFARTVRFQGLLAAVSPSRDPDWAGLAWDCGFADQAHLIREVQRFTGATPRRLEDDAFAFARHFVSADRLRAYFARNP